MWASPSFGPYKIVETERRGEESGIRGQGTNCKAGDAAVHLASRFVPRPLTPDP
jgi:hypothetical protein